MGTLRCLGLSVASMSIAAATGGLVGSNGRRREDGPHVFGLRLLFANADVDGDAPVGIGEQLVDGHIERVGVGPRLLVKKHRLRGARRRSRGTATTA